MEVDQPTYWKIDNNQQLHEDMADEDQKDTDNEHILNQRHESHNQYRQFTMDNVSIASRNQCGLTLEGEEEWLCEYAS